MPDLSSISRVTDPASLLDSVRPLPRAGATDPASLHHAAVQFESVLLGQWLESAERSFATVPGTDDDADAGGEQMMSFGMQQFASAIASSGGLGIARLVERGLTKAVSASTATTSRPITSEAPAGRTLVSQPPSANSSETSTLGAIQTADRIPHKFTSPTKSADL